MGPSRKEELPTDSPWQDQVHFSERENTKTVHPSAGRYGSSFVDASKPRILHGSERVANQIYAKSAEKVLAQC
jgi:hypothetical protein